MECKYFRVLQLLFDCLQDCADSLWLVFRVDEKCSFVWLMSQRVHLFRIKGVSPLGFAKLMIFASLGLLNSKSKAIAPLAAQADAPYFLGAKTLSPSPPSGPKGRMPCGAHLRRGSKNSLRSDTFDPSSGEACAPRRLPGSSTSKAQNQSQNQIQRPSPVNNQNDPLGHSNCQRSLAYEPLNSAEGNQTSGKPKRRKRATSTSIS